MISVRRSTGRARTTGPGIESRHSFSYGPHYDPDNLGFGALLVNNEDRLAPGAGFDRHAHRGVDILTWMLAGALEHEDSTGHAQVLRPGMAQLLRAGAGVHHAEHAAADGPGAHYVQMWIRSPVPGAAASYACADFSAALARVSPTPREPVVIASGRPASGPPGTTPLRLDQPAAELGAARMAAGDVVNLPAAALVHVFVTRGAVTTDTGHRLGAGDAARRQDGRRGHLTAARAAEVLIWQLPAPA